MKTTATEGFFDKAPVLIRATRNVDQSAVDVARAQASSPPDRITGGNLTLRASIDHLAGTAKASDHSALIALLERYISIGEERHRGANSYSESYGADELWFVAWSPGREECFVRIHGEGLHRIGVAIFDLMQDLYRFAFKPTRLDLAMDDFTKELLDLEQIEEDRRNVCGFRAWHPERRYRNVHTDEVEGRGGYFGRRGGDGSGVYWRYYDKGLESRGEIDSVRIEPEFTDEKCRDVWAKMLKAKDYAGMSVIAAGIIVGSIDFRDRTVGSGRKDRMPRLLWWQRVIDAIGRVIGLEVLRRKPALQETMEYFRDNYWRSVGRFGVVMMKKKLDPFAVWSRFLERAMERTVGDRIAENQAVTDDFDADSFLSVHWEDSADIYERGERDRAALPTPTDAQRAENFIERMMKHAHMVPDFD